MSVPSLMLVSKSARSFHLFPGLIIAYLNINSIRNKIDFLRPMISESIDVLILAETKLDNTFPASQFVIEGFMKPFRYDRNQNGDGLLVYCM